MNNRRFALFLLASHICALALGYFIAPPLHRQLPSLPPGSIVTLHEGALWADRDAWSKWSGRTPRRSDIEFVEQGDVWIYGHHVGRVEDRKFVPLP